MLTWLNKGKTGVKREKGLGEGRLPGAAADAEGPQQSRPLMVWHFWAFPPGMRPPC